MELERMTQQEIDEYGKTDEAFERMKELSQVFVEAAARPVVLWRRRRRSRMLQALGLLLVLVAIGSGAATGAMVVLWWAGTALIVVGGWRAHQAKRRAKTQAA